MNYYEVLPLVTTGAKDTVFTYESEEEVATGAIVQIPLRNRKVRGLVMNKVKKPTFATKPLAKILSAEPVLTETQINIATRIAEYYFSTVSDVISCILPFDFGKKRRELKVKNSKELKPEAQLKLTSEQKKCFEQISSAKPASKHLIFGVTGSGKTEVYLQLIAKALKNGQGSIVLVPEISLTPQTLSRFEKRFGDAVAVWHSGLLETEKFDTWQKIKSGEKMIVVGARSAVFLPIKDLAFVIIDEEHESSYKQDQNPRYEATKVAEWLGELTGAKLVLGSATPRVESYYKTQNGEYNLCTLTKRVCGDGLPPVKIVDLRDEFKKGNKSIFSDDLYGATNQALKQKKQVMLFVNRRGAATFVVCRDCGSVLECPHCEIPLTYHPSEGEKLTCHHCGYTRDVPSVCPNCHSHAIRYFGLGTQRVEIEAGKLFPNARIARMDRDTTKRRGSHEDIFENFLKGNFDILIGTQLIAKGWDLPNVAVVGVISADTTLNLPDFRASERTFDLLTQVAGRTGRGFHPGQVFVQTYSPENYAVRAAADHNFKEFYDREIKEREKYNYPPFSTLVKLMISGPVEKTIIEKAENLAEALGKINQKDLTILGPSAAFIPKLAGKYRWQIVLKLRKTKNEKRNRIEIRNSSLEINRTLKDAIKGGWTVDINPESLL